MASTYSPTLRIELIGTGDQSGLWGDTTNTNLGALIEQAITGVESIPMIDADYTLTALNGSVDEARNVVVIMTSIGSLTGSRNVFIPAVEKTYFFKNATTGGQNLVVKTSGGTGFTVPNGMTAAIYCDGTNVYQTTTYLDTPTINTPALTGIPTTPTASAGTNTAQIASTAFVNTAITTYFASGTRLMFAQAAAPTGWTQVTDDSATNRMLRVVNTAGAGIGGSASPILNNVVPSHTHTYSGTSSGQSQSHTHGVSATTGGMSANATHNHGVTDPGHNHTIASGGGSSGPQSYISIDTYYSTNYGTSASSTGIGINATNTDHTHSFSTTSGGASVDHTHTYSGTSDANAGATNWAPRYIDMILCSKN